MPVEKQILIIYTATNKYLIDVAVEDIQAFEKGLFEYVDTKYPEIFSTIREKKAIDDALEEVIVKAIKEFKEEFMKG